MHARVCRCAMHMDGNLSTQRGAGVCLPTLVGCRPLLCSAPSPLGSGVAGGSVGQVLVGRTWSLARCYMGDQPRAGLGPKLQLAGARQGVRDPPLPAANPPGAGGHQEESGQGQREDREGAGPARAGQLGPRLALRAGDHPAEDGPGVQPLQHLPGEVSAEPLHSSLVILGWGKLLHQLG